MTKVSVIIPARNEQFLKSTIQDVLVNATGDIEVVAVCDGYRPDAEEIVKDDRVIYIFKGVSEGMRPAITDGVAISSGDFIFKLDGHCMVSPGFDVVLSESCKPHWVVIPQRRRLDADNWCEQIQKDPIKKPHIDYERLSYPSDEADWGGAGLNGRIWTERILERQGKPEYDIDDNMSFQGSGWFTTKKHFYEGRLCDDERWGTFWNEAQLISFRTTLCDYDDAPGEVKVNKKAYYSHLHKGRTHGRGYRLEERQLQLGRNMAMKVFAGEQLWEDQVRPLSFLIEKFMPLPEWDEKKLEDLRKRERNHGWNV